MAVLAASEIESSSWRKLAIFWVALSLLFFGLFSLFLGSSFDPIANQDKVSINGLSSKFLPALIFCV